MRIIVVTKNIFYELELQEKLQILGHEVFVTQNNREDELLIKNVHLMDCIFVSDTFSDQEFFEIYQEVKTLYDYKIVRILPESDSIKEDIKEETDICYVNRSFVDLRDLLITLTLVRDTEKKSKSGVIKEIFRRSLSENERLFFDNLDEENIISREEMCQRLWGEVENASRKSQLSSLAKRVNEKLEAYSDTEKRVKTYWNKGYIFQ